MGAEEPSVMEPQPAAQLIAAQALLLPGENCPGMHRAHPSVAFLEASFDDPEPAAQLMGAQALLPPAEYCPTVQGRHPSV